MIGRNSMKNLTKTISFFMSKKKITQQWRKPIEQLKKQKQENEPIHPDADSNKKMARQFIQTQMKKHGGNIDVPKKPKKFLNKEKDTTTPPQQLGQQIKTQKKVSETNWLQLQQFNNPKQLTQMTNEALNMFRLKYTPQLKDVISKIREKFNIQGLEFALNSLFKVDFLRVYDQFKQLQIQVPKINSQRIITTILLNLAQLQQLTKLEALLSDLSKQKTQMEHRHEQFFQLLFFKQTSQDIKFLAGQNGVNISAQNKVLVQKMEIATQYLKVMQEQAKRKKGIRRATVIPMWIDRVSKIILRYKFGVNQFRTLLSQVLTHQQYLIPENFYETQQFAVLIREFYFGNQSELSVLLGVLERNLNKVKFSTFYRNFSDQLMNYRIQNQQPAFLVDEVLIQNYKKAFQSNSKYLAIVCSIIASDAGYMDLPQHYVRYYMQGFKNQSLASQDTKFVEEGILNNYDRVNHAEKNQKDITRMIKSGSNLFIKLKAAIKLGEMTMGFKMFQQQVLKKAIITRQRKNIQFILRGRLGDKASNFLRLREVTQFIQTLNDQYLWSLYKRNEDVSVMLDKYIPEDKFSFWEERQNKERFEQISRKLATGQLEKIRQPYSDIQASGFSFDQYLKSEFPHLQALQVQQYEKQRQMIQYTLRIEGLIMVHKIHNDHLVVQKMKQFQDALSQQNLATLQLFGLKDYDIYQYEWQHFEKRFQQMKLQSGIQRDQRVDWSGFEKFIERSKFITKKNIIEEMMVKLPQVFRQADALVKLEQDPIVNRLLLWGVYTNEPMAIYLAEKLAMQTGQVIPHDLALKVSRKLSFKRPLSEQFISKCKQCLKIVGKIDREFIYLFDKQYEHILIRKSFTKYITDRVQSSKYDNRDLQDLIGINPRQNTFQKQIRLYKDSIINRAHNLV